MEKAQRKTLLLNKSRLVGDIQTEQIIWELKQFEVLTPILFKDIEQESGRKAKLNRLIDLITSCGPKSFQIFIEILTKHGYNELVESLKSDYQRFRNDDASKKKTKLIPIPRTYGEVCLNNRESFIENVWAEHIVPELRPPLQLSNLDKQLLRTEKSRRNRSEILFDLLLQKVDEHGHKAFFMLHGILDRTYPHVSDLVWNDLMKMTAPTPEVHLPKHSPAPPNHNRDNFIGTISDTEYSQELQKNKKHTGLKSSLNVMQQELLNTGADSLGRSRQLDRASQLIAEANGAIKMLESRIKCVEREREDAQHLERVANMQCKDLKKQIEMLEHESRQIRKQDEDHRKRWENNKKLKMDELQKMNDELKSLENDLHKTQLDQNQKHEELIQRKRNLDIIESSLSEKDENQRDRSAKSMKKQQNIKQRDVEVTRREADVIIREREVENREDSCRKTGLEQRRRSMELKRREAEAIVLQEQYQMKEDNLNDQIKENKIKQSEIMAQLKDLKKQGENLDEQNMEQSMKEELLREKENSIEQRERDTKAALQQKTAALEEEKELVELERQRWYSEWRQKEHNIKQTEEEWNKKTDELQDRERTLRNMEDEMNKKNNELRQAQKECKERTDENQRKEEELTIETKRLYEKEHKLKSRKTDLDKREQDIGSIEHGRRVLNEDVERFKAEQRDREKDFMLRYEEMDTKYEQLRKQEDMLINIQMKQRQRELLLQKRENNNYMLEDDPSNTVQNNVETVTRTSSDSGLTDEPIMCEYTIVQRGDDQNSPRRFQPFNIKVSPGLTIWGLKTILDKEEGIPTHWQRFYYGGIQLNDTTTLSENSIVPESSIYLKLDVKEGSTTIILKTGQRTRMIDVDLNETVAVTKARIYKYEGVPPHQQILLHRDVVMDDGNLLHDFNLHKNSAISMKLNYRIWVRTKSNTLIPLEVDELSTIRNVKFLLREAAGVCVDSQKLGFRGKFLDDSRSLIHYKICEGSTVDLTCAVTISQKPAGESLKMELDPCVTVKQLKEEIRRIKAIPVNRQALVVRDQHLHDGDMVMDHLKKGSIINLHSGNVMIVSSSGKVILSDVQPWHNVLKVKEMIERKTGITVHMQHLEYQGSALVSGSLRLSDFDIKNGSVLQMKQIEG
ncbi:uncharacterized protein [Antedon mediterranea]|uniref:uncharacterized protein n=1 Tax=Antedon mediterranea TaxID=105859 RepID=UPI003AF85722